MHRPELALILCLFAHVSLTERIYFISMHATQWQFAKYHCELIGGMLAKILTLQESQEIDDSRNLIEYEAVWLGGTKAKGVEDWKWIDGTAVDWSIPGLSVPNIDIQTRYVMKMSNNGQWVYIMDDPLTSLPYVCEADTENSPDNVILERRSCWVENGLFLPPPGTSLVPCPMKKQFFSPEHYWFKAKWTKAQTLCEEAGGDMAKVRDSEEHTIIILLRAGFVTLYDTAYRNMWLGGRRDSAGVWTWPDGENFTWPMFVPSIVEDQPGEACLHLTHENSWDDADCTTELLFFCERNISKQRSLDDVCFWGGPSHIILSAASSYCETYGGHLAKIDNGQEFRMLQPLILGERSWTSGHLDGTGENIYRWYDSSLMTWHRWSPGDPDAGTHSQVALTTWVVDLETDSPIYPLCEKNVSGSSEYLEKSVSLNQVMFRPKEGVRFAGEMQEMTFECSSSTSFNDFMASLKYKSKVLLKNPGWYNSMENLSASAFYTSEEENCFDVATIIQHVPMAVFELQSYPKSEERFKVKIKANFPGEALKVFTRVKVEMLAGNGDYTWLLKECPLIKGSDFVFECQCSSPCLINIHITKNYGPKQTALVHLEICGISLY